MFVCMASSPGGRSLGRRCWLIGTGVEDKQQMVPQGKDGTQCGKCSLPGSDSEGEGSRPSALQQRVETQRVSNVHSG